MDDELVDFIKLYFICGISPITCMLATRIVVGLNTYCGIKLKVYVQAYVGGMHKHKFYLIDTL